MGNSQTVTVTFKSKDSALEQAASMEHVPRVGDIVELKSEGDGFYRRLLVKEATWNIHPYKGGTNYNVELLVEVLR